LHNTFRSMQVRLWAFIHHLYSGLTLFKRQKPTLASFAHCLAAILNTSLTNLVAILQVGSSLLTVIGISILLRGSQMMNHHHRNTIAA
jgi:hypothetical protein